MSNYHDLWVDNVSEYSDLDCVWRDKIIMTASIEIVAVLVSVTGRRSCCYLRRNQQILYHTVNSGNIIKSDSVIVNYYNKQSHIFWNKIWMYWNQFMYHTTKLSNPTWVTDWYFIIHSFRDPHMLKYIR